MSKLSSSNWTSLIARRYKIGLIRETKTLNYSERVSERGSGQRSGKILVETKKQIWEMRLEL